MKITKIISCAILTSGLVSQIAFAQETNLTDQILNTPYHKEMRERGIIKMKDALLKNKNEVLETLNKEKNYSPEQYKELYNNYEVNPPFTFVDGEPSFNEDYEKRQDEQEEQPATNETTTETQPPIVSQKQPTPIQQPTPTKPRKKRLGVRNLNINPSLF